MLTGKGQAEFANNCQNGVVDDLHNADTLSVSAGFKGSHQCRPEKTQRKVVHRASATSKRWSGFCGADWRLGGEPLRSVYWPVSLLCYRQCSLGWPLHDMIGHLDMHFGNISQKVHAKERETNGELEERWTKSENGVETDNRWNGKGDRPGEVWICLRMLFCGSL